MTGEDKRKTEGQWVIGLIEMGKQIIVHVSGGPGCQAHWEEKRGTLVIQRGSSTGSCFIEKKECKGKNTNKHTEKHIQG